MSKLILTGIGIAATLGLAACDYDRDEYNAANADYNAEEANYADENAADYNMGDMNDMNDMNAMDNATENATGNMASENTTNSY